MNKVNFGIIGCGVIADWHAKSIIRSNGGALIGVADTRFENASAFAEKYSVRAYSSVEEMLADSSIDAVCVCTPSGFHAAVALKVLEANKHILIEKPLAISDEDCDAVIKMAKKNNRCAGVISQLRFSPDIQKVRQLVAEGRLGKIISADLIMKFLRSQEYYDSSEWRGTWALDGGSLMNQGIHGVDILLFIMGKVQSVYGYARTLSHNMEAEDTAVAALEFENGALGIIESSTSIYPGYLRKLVISGTKGTVCLEDEEISVCDIENYTLTKAEKTKNNLKGSFNDPKAFSTAGHEQQLQDFIDAIKEGREPAVPLSEGSNAVRLINAVYTSSKIKKPIEIN